MKKFLIALLALSTFAPNALAVTPAEDQSELLEQNLKDYFDFEEDTWWSYEVRTVDNVNDVDSQAHYKKTQLKCDVKKDCYTAESDTGTNTTYLEDGVLYVYDHDGKRPSKTYTALELQGYMEEIAIKDYEQFGLTGFDNRSTFSCVY